AFVFRSFLLEPYQIPSASMRPTLMEGDHLFVAKYSYGYSRYSFPFSPPLFRGRIFAQEPQRGDIVVFRGRDGGDKEYYIKRIVGMPGDQIQMKLGVLHINGNAIDSRPCGEFSH